MFSVGQIVENIAIQTYFDEVIVPQMTDYYSDWYPDFENKPVAKCPLHGEKTASFRVYEETKSFYCWGCGKGGNVIRLHQLFTEGLSNTEIDKETAIKFLGEYFLRGNTSVSSVATDNKKDEHISSVVEVIRLGQYVKKIEGIVREQDISLECKIAKWKSIDDVSKLVGKNMVNATDAMKYLKEIFTS